jgi:hypothetical protein
LVDNRFLQTADSSQISMPSAFMSDGILMYRLCSFTLILKRAYTIRHAGGNLDQAGKASVRNLAAVVVQLECLNSL